LEAYEVIAEDVTRQRELEDHLRRQAASDPLTGLANYRCLVDVPDSEIKRSKRTSREFALLLFDVDGLKSINDRHGHMVGSQALCRLADVLSSCCGDQRKAANGWPVASAKALPMTKRDPSFPSAGVLPFIPENGETIERLLCEADSGLYVRKQQRMFACGVQAHLHGAVGLFRRSAPN